MLNEKKGVRIWKIEVFYREDLCLGTLERLHAPPAHCMHEFIKLVKHESFPVQVSVLQRVGCPGDHFFLLNHILRCPAGVSKWAVPFIQV